MSQAKSAEENIISILDQAERRMHLEDRVEEVDQ